MEQTLIVLKPDAVLRGLTGELLGRFERAGLKLVAAKMIQVDQELAKKHYPADREEWIKLLGHKTLDNYKELKKDAKKEMGTDDPMKLGQMVRGWLLDYISSGPVFAAVLEGPHAVELVRKITGHTLPFKAEPGTIRGDFSFDSSHLANTAKRAIKNLIHASGNIEEAQYEIPLWFSEEEICKYERANEKAMK